MSSTSNVRSSSGASLAISRGLPVTYTAAGFEALAFVEVAEVTEIPEFGRAYNPVTHAALSRRRVVKRKGNFDEGDLSVPMGRDAKDDGQKLMKEAESSDDSFSFRIELQDGTRFFFTAQCMSYRTTIGGGDSITGRTASLAIDNEILEVDAVTFVLAYAATANQGSIVGQANQTVLRGGTGAPVFAQAAANFVFLKWSDDKTDNPRADSNVQAAVSVTAQFEAA